MIAFHLYFSSHFHQRPSKPLTRDHPIIPNEQLNQSTIAKATAASAILVNTVLLATLTLSICQNRSLCACVWAYSVHVCGSTNLHPQLAVQQLHTGLFQLNRRGARPVVDGTVGSPLHNLGTRADHEQKSSRS